MKKLFTVVYTLFVVAAAVAAPTANEDFVIAEDAQTYTNAVNAAREYTDGATNAAVSAAKAYADTLAPGDYANVSNKAMSALQPSATNGLITKAEVDLRFETTPDYGDISDLSDRIIAVSRSAMTTNDVCNIVTNTVTGWVMEMVDEYGWMVPQPTARFVLNDVIWAPQGDGSYTVTFTANGEAKSISYPDGVEHSVICTDRECYLYFGSIEDTVADVMPALSMPDEWTLALGTTGGHDQGADGFTYQNRNALGLARLEDIPPPAVGGVSSVNSKTGDVVLAASDVGAYSSAAGNTLAGQVATIGAHLNAEDARFVVTNYNSVTHVPEAYVEIKLPDESWSRIWSEVTRWTNFLGLTWDWSTWGGFHAWATNVNAELSHKADRAWGFYDSSTGEYAPDGYTWISSEKIAIAGGLAYQRTVTSEGAIWVLESTGAVTETGGLTNGFFRISDDEGNSLFEIVKGDKRTVGADASSCVALAGFSPTKLQIGYSVVGPQPVIYVCNSLMTQNWKAETDSDCLANVSWSGESGAWIAQVQGKTAQSSLFVKATYEVGGETHIRNAVPVSMQYIMLNGVKYAVGTATISSKTVLTLTVAQ